MIQPGRFRRGDTSSERPGLMFWGKLRGKDRWMTPEKFEEYRQKKNALARGTVLTPQAAARRRQRDNERRKTPQAKAKAAAFQKAKRHIYSPRGRQRRRDYKKMRRAADPVFKIKELLGTRIRLGFKRQCSRKQTKCIELLGCTFEFFKHWIADQFEEGMTFENHSFDTWHIDHIIPVCLFDLSDETAAKHAFNYRNCRPAWGKPNLSKNGRLDVSLVAKHNLWEWLPYTSSHSELKHAA